jgi:S1-C subfamily serine protease
METRPTLVAFVMVMGFIGSTQAQTAKGEFVKQAKEYLASDRAREFEENESCRLGIKINLDLVVLWASQRQRDLRAGDKIVQLNSSDVRSQDDYYALVAAIAPGSQVNLTIERDRDRKQIVGACKSSREYGRQHNDVFRMIAKKDFDGCVATVRSLVMIDGQSSDMEWLYFNCATHSGQLPVAQRPPEVYELWRLRIEEAKWDPTELARMRGRVIADENYFHSNGYASLYRELERMLDEAGERKGPTRVAAAVVPLPKDPELAGTGTGFVVSSSGTVITSNHVIDGAKRIVVHFADATQAEATVAGRSSMTDLAVLETQSPREIFLGLASPRSASVGMRVFTYGFPVTEVLGREPKYTGGTVSALTGLDDDQTYLQMSVPVQPGNSGGPVIDDRGNVVGVVASTAAIASFFRTTGALPQNVNWAVKAEYAGLLYTQTSKPPAPASREGVVERARSAIVFVEVFK